VFQQGEIDSIGGWVALADNPGDWVLGSNGTENTLKDSGGVLCRLGRVAEFRRSYAGTYQGVTRRGQR
jgi:hypothetical protein